MVAPLIAESYSIGVRGCVRPGTDYVVPARVGVWLVRGTLPGSDRRLRFVAAARFPGSVFFPGTVLCGVSFRGRGPHGCVLLVEIYKMSYGRYV